MHIIIPMSGMGRRFQAFGIKDPKPLIKVDGEPLIKWLLSMFPRDAKFTFICNTVHLSETPLKKELLKLCPKGQIVSIEPHHKGPVFAVAQVFDTIGDNEETIVNYCDFSCYWDYKAFIETIHARKAEGAIACYRGFHPHMLGKTNYAFVKDTDQWMEAIQEKQPFTDNRMNEFASSGTYYFRKGSYVKKYFQQALDRDLKVNDEFYISLVYNLLVEEKLKVFIYEIQHMLQWGEPLDLLEYQRWSDYFASMTKPQPRLDLSKDTAMLMPMAGAGKRFADEGYQEPKPLIPVGGHPMVVQACRYLPQASNQIFVCRAEHLKNYSIEKNILEHYPKAQIISLDQVTQGQACTCEVGLKGVAEDVPLLIGACDNGMLWDERKLEKLIEDRNVDGIIFTFRRYPTSVRNPQMYGWVKVDGEDNVLGLSVKKPISDDPYHDHAVIGSFYFRKTKFFLEGLKSLYKHNRRINNEFYVDSLMGELVSLGYKLKVFEVEHYLCWGTPNDYRTYEYWQSFFHKCDWHPYKLADDWSVNPKAIASLEKRFFDFKHRQ